MRVVQATQFGGPDVLVVTEAPDPVAGAGQVVIDVAVAGVLSVDAAIRRGQGSARFPVTPPYVPGYAVAGRVSSVGDGVDPGWVGRNVVAEAAGGGYAERAVTGADRLIAVPDGLGAAEAAALIQDGSTALGLFESASVQPGAWVLIQPAAGGLGSLLTQLNHAGGARVVAGVRGDSKLRLATELGAEAAVDYAEPGWAERAVEVTGGGPDVVFDGVGGDAGRAAFGIVRPGGLLSVYGAAAGRPTMVDPAEAAQREVTVRGIDQLGALFPGAKQRAERMLGEAAAGRVHPVIGHIYPLADAVQAHQAIESRTFTGKLLLQI